MRPSPDCTPPGKTIGSTRSTNFSELGNYASFAISRASQTASLIGIGRRLTATLARFVRSLR